MILHRAKLVQTSEQETGSECEMTRYEQGPSRRVTHCGYRLGQWVDLRRSSDCSGKQ
jgi:hypothetical protein